jgi:signal transduction histidine kinase
MNKNESLQVTYQKFCATGFGSRSLEDAHEFIAENVMGFGSTVDEKIFSLQGFLELIQRQSEQSAGLNITWEATPLFKHITADGNTGIIAETIILTVETNGEQVKMELRLSAVLEFIHERWTVLHWHGSKPELVSTYEDTWGGDELKKQAQKLEKLLEERTAELRATQAQLIQREKLASLGELTAGIAHEIQNPLNFVNNFAEVSSELVGEMQTEITQGNTEEVQAIAHDLKQNLDKINHHGKRASSIVKNMLEHSRTSNGSKDATHRVSTDINALVDECLRLSYHGLRAQAKGFNADYALNLADNLPLMEVVSQDIGRVLLNLFNNAFYAVHQKQKQFRESPNTAVETLHATSLQFPAYQPTVTVSTHKTEQGILIQIQDNGSGVPEALKPKIFQPFFTTKPTGEGTGLGLSLSYDIITKGHGGTLELESIEGVGSTFSIMLPFHSPSKS